MNLSASNTSTPNRQLIQLVSAVFLGLLLFFIFLTAAVTGYQLLYLGRIYPGVHVAGVDLSALTPEEAEEALSARLTFPNQGQITLVDQDNEWTLSPIELGFFLDTKSTVDLAYQVGRTGLTQRLIDQFEAVYHGRTITPVFLYDQRVTNQILELLRPMTDLPMIDATLSLNQLEVIVTPGQHGRKLNLEQNLQLIQQQLYSLENGVIPLAIDALPAAILDASQEADLAKEILSEKFTIELPKDDNSGEGPWIIEREDLAKMLELKPQANENGQETYQIGIREDQLRVFLSTFAAELSRDEKNPRFIFNDDTRKLEVLESAVIGREVDFAMTAQAIESALLEGKHQAVIDFEYTNPPVTNETPGSELGITELVHAETSYFYGSDGARVQNIQTAASRFHGLLVPPQTTFSMAEVLGDVSLDNGYAEAWIIFGDQTIKGVGGGVCQVSTTLFRAAFFTGFPITERHPHAYRVYYYEKVYGNKINTNFAGLDATVYVPVVDLKFKNDTDNWLLIETYVYPASSSITFKFYSTSDQREVEWSTTGLTDIEPEPEAVYRENKDLAEGQIKQVDWGIDGGRVTVYREVKRDGAAYFNDSFYTYYQPWRDVYEFGPGTELPEDANVE
ncbi:MAG: VanW family protein [Anaerolineaceae bacterium]|nr:VanW family protein [Anaerolineaceae bacterium]